MCFFVHCTFVHCYLLLLYHPRVPELANKLVKLVLYRKLLNILKYHGITNNINTWQNMYQIDYCKYWKYKLSDNISISYTNVDAKYFPVYRTLHE